MNANEARIAFVTPSIRDYRIDLFEALAGAFDIEFVLTGDNGGGNGLRDETWDRSEMEGPRELPPLLSSRISRPLRPGSRSGTSRFGGHTGLVRHLRKKKYDIVMSTTSMYASFLGAKLAGSAFIYVTEFWHFPQNSIARRTLNAISRFIIRRADAVIATGMKGYASHVEILGGSGNIFRTKQSSQDLKELSKSEEDNSPMKSKTIPGNDIGCSEDTPVILFIGRLLKLKGVQHLIRAFEEVGRKIEDSILVIAGEGEYKRDLEELAAGSGNPGRIHFIGHVTGRRKWDLYERCNVFVLPSVIDRDKFEAWGLVLNEAMSFGKPVVATDAVGSSEDLIISGENGFIVRNGDVQELGDALLRILSDREEAEVMGRRSREIFESVNDHRKIEEVYFNAIRYVIDSAMDGTAG